MFDKVRVLTVAALLVGCHAPSMAADAEGNKNAVTTIKGKIAYTRIDTGAWRGDEDFHLTVHPDGSRTIRITNALDETQVLRDVVMRVDKRMRPLDLYVSHWKDGEHRGTGFYRVGEEYLDAVISAPNGELRQRVRVPDKVSLATRPQAAFGWHFWYLDFAKRGLQKTDIFVLSKWGLDVGSILGELTEYEVEVFGEERIKVAAGEFDTWHFRLGGIYELWIEKENWITVKLQREDKNRLYELVEYSQ